MNPENIDLSCKEAARLMSHRQDRKLSEGEAVDLENHLLVCLSCRNFSDQLGLLSRFARHYGSDDPPPEAPPPV